MLGDDTPIDVVDVSSDDAVAQPPTFDISDTEVGTVTVDANKTSYWPLILVALAIGAVWYFGGDHEEA